MTTGTILGPYEILTPLGQGGMGEVWKARDNRLDRTVAVKVSKAAFTDRFEREARAVAALNHPHICTLYDVGPNYLVMEFVEGTILKGPLPVDKAVEYAGQILDALDAAHRKGITHRDLKPGNIMVTKQGIKLLDFGLAKQSQGPIKESDATVTDALTQQGQIVGTLPYMAPEQLQGKPADARSDIFAFGCVLYEILSGKRAFPGSNSPSIMASILEREPAPLDLHPPLQRVIATCLAKDPDQRFQNAVDLKRALLWAMEQPRKGESNPKPKRWNWAAATAALALAAGGWAVLRPRPLRSDEPSIRFQISPPENSAFTFLAVSPDGRRVAFTATDSTNRSQLWVRSISYVAAQPLAGTEGAVNPFWSPDSRFIAFVAEGKLKKIDTTGGPAQVLADAPESRSGGAWSPDGVIVFAPFPLGPLYQIPATGGEPKLLTQLDRSRQETNHRWPQFLPDGRHFLYFIDSSQSGIYVGSLDSKENVRLLSSQTSAAFAGPVAGEGYLLFLRDGTLLGQPFDPQKPQIKGEAIPLGAQVGASDERTRLSVSNAVLVYDSMVREDELRWFDRNGRPMEKVGPPGRYINFDLSPDDRRVAAMVRGDIWLFDVTRAASTRFTFNPAMDTASIWSPDGQRIIFTSNRGGPWNLYQKLSNGTGEEELLLNTNGTQLANSWSPDGKFVIFSQNMGTKSGWDLWVLPLEGERKSFPLLQTEFNEHWGRFSPDGKWVAYVSNESGRDEVFVRTFAPDPHHTALKWQVSNGGGQLPRWRADGKELFFLGPNRQMMVAAAKPGGTLASSFERANPRELFSTRAEKGNFASYAVTSDGQRFLIYQQAHNQASGPATVVVNWAAGLKR